MGPLCLGINLHLSVLIALFHINLILISTNPDPNLHTVDQQF